MNKTLKAELVLTTQEIYEDVPPPSNAFRFSLFRRRNAGEFVFCDAADVDVNIGSVCRFVIIESGEYQARCQRLNVLGHLIGPEAVSSSCYIGSGTYAAPLTLTLGLEVV